MGRVHINSCDFSVASYSFDDVDGDFELKRFDMNVQHDVTSGMIGMMTEATTTAKYSWPETKDEGLRIFASPWSPPAWMKKPTEVDPPGSTHAVNMTGSDLPNCLRDGVGPTSRYAAAWALYFSKFITACK